MEQLIAEIIKLPPALILVTGASGAGKTTMMQCIESLLPASLISVNYFDSIGVPSIEDMNAQYGSGLKWQEITIQRWIDKLRTLNRKLIFLEGSFYPEFAMSYLQKRAIKNAVVICIHCQQSIREKRLINLRQQPELVHDDMENYAQILKAKTIHLGGMIIEASHENPSLNAYKMLEMLVDYIKVKC